MEKPKMTIKQFRVRAIFAVTAGLIFVGILLLIFTKVFNLGIRGPIIIMTLTTISVIIAGLIGYHNGKIRHYGYTGKEINFPLGKPHSK